MKRRHFVAASAAAAVSASGETQPRKALKINHWGPEFYDEAEQRELTAVIESRNPFRWYAGADSKVLAFEREFAARMGTKYVVAVTSGTAALHTALAALQIGPGDEVILPAWTWHSCFNTIVMMGALPVIAEIDESFNIDPADIERHITPQTKAIMAVHLQGTPCAMDRVLEIARKHKLKVIEDCAQSVGASYKGRPLGSLGDIGIYSLQMNKTITAGEGGAVVTNNPEIFERAARFHDLGGLRGPHQTLLGGKPALDWLVGTNFRMSELTGGVLLAQTRKLDRIVGSVRANAARVYEGIRDLPDLKPRRLPDPQGELGSAIFLDFGSRARCDKFLAAMKAENVTASRPGGSVILPTLPHIIAKKTIHAAWPSFQTARGKAMRYGPETCPRTIDILGRFGGVLMDPRYTRRDLGDIIAAIRKVYPVVAGA